MTSCRTRVQCVPVHERVSTCPQPLSLPMPRPRKAYHRNCAEYRPIPGGRPGDNPASHRGEVVYAGDHQVNCKHDERVPPREERAPPGASRHARCAQPTLPTPCSYACSGCPAPSCQAAPQGPPAAPLIRMHIVPHWQGRQHVRCGQTTRLSLLHWLPYCSCVVN